MRHRSVIIIFGIMVLAILNPLIGLSESADNQQPVVCTTSILTHLTEEIGQEFITVTTIAPAGMCPAHFDIKPSQIQAVREAKILISHNFEPWIENLLTSADNTNIERLVLAGPWNTPASAMEKINQISDALSKQFPENEPQFHLNAQNFIKSIKRDADVMKSKADQLNVSQFKVIASFHQASFVEWLGFDIVTTYPSPETISTKQFLELLLIGKREKVDLIVDNLQSGTDFGAKLASDLNSTQAILTNFPGLIPQTESLAEMLSYNAEQLFNTIEVK
jgi:zinc transport system substrate-binding protein